ncbi:MAG: acyl-CoA dehydrogenase, N-terminal domain protein, partial [Steroidobacteraceae bacterium]|nr:acyl-CoA dehydrogenase, N-terminal domain protein [Steroidobacteraceae bacterium]
MLFTHEHHELRRTVERFCREQLNPYVDEWEEAGIYPAHEVFRKLGDLGLLGLTKPAAVGGADLDYSYAVAMAEALGACRCGAVPMSIGVQTDMATPALARFGSPDLQQEFLAPAIAGDMVACIGVSEPGAGSDVAAIRTTARKDGGDYVINGGKLWITNGAQADWMCCLASTSEGGPHRNKSLIVVPMRTPGVTVARTIRKLGMLASDTAQIHFDDVRVPQRYRIGDEGMGFPYQMQQFQQERLWAAANALQGLDNAIADTVAYTRERRIFGRSVLDNQVVHYTLAELQTEVEALRALVYRATELFVAGQDVT